MSDRSHYRIDLATAEVTTEPGVRALASNDRDQLPSLMLAAYAGTVDDEGESLDEAIDEIDGWLEHGGRLDRSFGIEIDGALCSAALVSIVPKGAILASVITRPDQKQQGHGRRVVAAAIEALRSDGHDELHLWITDDNVPSEALFRGLGAERVDD